jgi:hypothetical protein
MYDINVTKCLLFSVPSPKVPPSKRYYRFECASPSVRSAPDSITDISIIYSFRKLTTGIIPLSVGTFLFPGTHSLNLDASASSNRPNAIELYMNAIALPPPPPVLALFSPVSLIKTGL